MNDNEKVFPDINGNAIKSGIVVGNERIIILYPLILKYLRNILNGWSIDSFFINIGCAKVALYAVTELMEFVLCDMRNQGVLGKIQGLYDKNSNRYANKMYGLDVEAIDKLKKEYEESKIDCVIVTSFIHENEIVDELIHAGIALDRIFTLSEILFMS